MKISSISNTNYEVKNHKNRASAYSAVTSEAKPQSAPSFGSLKSSIGSGASKIFDGIEKGGFFLGFFIVDTISMIVPRIIVGLNRDKEKLGHLNYQAGAEEAGREILSGPSMNLIPMGLVLATTAAKPASHIGNETLTSLTHNFEKVLAKNKTTDKSQLSKKLAETIFDDAFSSNLDASKAKKYKAEFTNLLSESANLKPKNFITRIFKKDDPFSTASKKFTEIVNEINCNTKNMELDPKAVILSVKEGKKAGGLKASALFQDFHHYSKDIIEKVSADKGNNCKELLNKLTKNRQTLKTASAVAAFFAVGAFLKGLPKIYQQGDVSPAMQSAKLAEGGTNEN